MKSKIHEVGHIIAILALMGIGISALEAGADTYIVPLCIVSIAGIAGYKIKNGLKPPTPPSG
jgi:hypothetical protein